jgi:hypothetical protein
MYAAVFPQGLKLGPEACISVYQSTLIGPRGVLIGGVFELLNGRTVPSPKPMADISLAMVVPYFCSLASRVCAALQCAGFSLLFAGPTWPEIYYRIAIPSELIHSISPTMDM